MTTELTDQLREAAAAAAAALRAGNREGAIAILEEAAGSGETGDRATILRELAQR